MERGLGLGRVDVVGLEQEGGDDVGAGGGKVVLGPVHVGGGDEVELGVTAVLVHALACEDLGVALGHGVSVIGPVGRAAVEVVLAEGGADVGEDAGGEDHEAPVDAVADALLDHVGVDRDVGAVHLGVAGQIVEESTDAGGEVDDDVGSVDVEEEVHCDGVLEVGVLPGGKDEFARVQGGCEALSARPTRPLLPVTRTFISDFCWR